MKMTEGVTRHLLHLQKDPILLYIFEKKPYPTLLSSAFIFDAPTHFFLFFVFLPFFFLAPKLTLIFFSMANHVNHATPSSAPLSQHINIEENRLFVGQLPRSCTEEDVSIYINSTLQILQLYLF